MTRWFVCVHVHCPSVVFSCCSALTFGLILSISSHLLSNNTKCAHIGTVQLLLCLPCLPLPLDYHSHAHPHYIATNAERVQRSTGLSSGFGRGRVAAAVYLVDAINAHPALFQRRDEANQKLRRLLPALHGRWRCVSIPFFAVFVALLYPSDVFLHRLCILATH